MIPPGAAFMIKCGGIMKSSLIPEKPILVYPSLAATVGLDESVMLATLSDLVANTNGASNNGYLWYSLPRETLQQALPFWDLRDLQRVSTNLREKGIIIIASAPLPQDDKFKFAFNEASAQKQPTIPPPAQVMAQAPTAPPPYQGKTYIAGNWQPNDTTLMQLGQLNIPSEFALQQVPEFVTYWRERNETQRSWEQKFISWTIPRWRKFEETESRRQKATAIASNWQPNANTLVDLTEGKVPQQFILDQVREFIAYWQATGEQHLSWDSKFIQRVQSRWADSESKRNVTREQMAIQSGWRPSQDAIEVMTGRAEIPLSFIDDTIPEFIIYWQEKGIRSNTWNTLFIKHVRLQWHRFQHALEHNTEAQAIHPQWQPSADVYDILKLANIESNFAHGLVAEFVLYWRERNEVHRSWNSKFLHHAKRTWAAQHQITISTASNNTRSTRNISLEEELSDTSWAN